MKEKEMETSLTLSAVIFGLSARWRLSFPLRGGSSSFLYWPPLERIKNLLFPLFRPSFLLPEQEKIPWPTSIRFPDNVNQNLPPTLDDQADSERKAE